MPTTRLPIVQTSSMGNCTVRSKTLNMFGGVRPGEGKRTLHDTGVRFVPVGCVLSLGQGFGEGGSQVNTFEQVQVVVTRLLLPRTVDRDNHRQTRLKTFEWSWKIPFQLTSTQAAI